MGVYGSKHVYVCSMYMYVAGTCSAQGDHKILRDPLKLELTDNCEPLCECWESNPSPLEDQPMFLTTEPFHQLQEAELGRLVGIRRQPVLKIACHQA